MPMELFEKRCRHVIASRKAYAVIQPRKNVKPWKDRRIRSLQRHELLKMVKYLGRTIWKKWFGCHWRSLVENEMNCIKLLGDKLNARNFYS